MAGRKVLTVDDDQSTRRLIKLILELELEGVEVLEAANGSECMEIVMAQEVDLILLDLHMPGINGWDVLRTLRSSVLLAAIPTIILSGEHPDSGLIRELQPEDYILKPFDCGDLALRVKKYLSNGCSRRANGC